MQTAPLTIANPFSPGGIIASTKTISHRITSTSTSSSSPRLQSLSCTPIKAATVTTEDLSTVDYTSSLTSVFPAEACETIGGEACDVEMYPEVKLKPPQGSQRTRTTTTTTSDSEPFDTDYLDYDTPKTVFLDEACDVLGGEFCEAADRGPN